NKSASGPVTITPTPAPDLAPTLVKATPPGSPNVLTSATAGDTIDVTWTVGNNGPGDAAGSWTDSLHLKEVGGTPDLALGASPAAGPVQANTTYTRGEQVQRPARVQGQFQLVVKANAQGSLFENGVTANNSLVSPDLLTIGLPHNPDLQVFSITDGPS